MNEINRDLEGVLPEDDLRRAFIAGVAWWEFKQFGATLSPSDRWLAETEAEKRYPGGKTKKNNAM